MQTNGPGNNGSDPPQDSPPPLPQSSPDGGRETFVAPPIEGDADYDVRRTAHIAQKRSMSIWAKVGIAILIILAGVPVALALFGALLFGACLLGR